MAFNDLGWIMSSDLAIKRANHREQMERVDVKHKQEVRRLRNQQNKEMSDLRNNLTQNKAKPQQNQNNQLEKMKLSNQNLQEQEKISHQRKLDEQKLQAQKQYQQAAFKRQQENARAKQNAALEKEKYVATKDYYAKQRAQKKDLTEREIKQLDEENKFRVRQERVKNSEQINSIREGHNKELGRMDRMNHEFLHKRKHDFSHYKRRIMNSR